MNGQCANQFATPILYAESNDTTRAARAQCTAVLASRQCNRLCIGCARAKTPYSGKTSILCAQQVDTIVVCHKNGGRAT